TPLFCAVNRPSLGGFVRANECLPGRTVLGNHDDKRRLPAAGRASGGLHISANRACAAGHKIPTTRSWHFRGERSVRHSNTGLGTARSFHRRAAFVRKFGTGFSHSSMLETPCRDGQQRGPPLLSGREPPSRSVPRTTLQHQPSQRRVRVVL